MVLRTTSVQIAVIIDLTVVHDASRFIPHHLMATDEVNDTEPPHGEREVLTPQLPSSSGPR
jgi:hypothetical protein